MKKTIKTALSLALCAAMIIAAALPGFCTGKEELPVEISAAAAVLMDASTGEVLMEYESEKKLYPASVTKVMSLLLVMEAIDSGKINLSDTVTASAAAAGKGGSQIWLKEGETMTVDELLRATAIYSANDACTALGEYVAGSDEAFVEMMNKRAAALGMKNTHFDNCTGLDDETDTHLTTAMDVAIMSRELLKHEKICNYSTVWMDSLRGGKTELVNTNKLVRFYDGTTGLKTGTTSKAGCCVSASAERGGTHLIAVVMGSPTSNERFNSAKAMLNWGFANYTTIVPETDKKLIPDVNVLNGVTERITPEIGSASPLLIKKGCEGELKQTIDLAVDVEAPVTEGQVLGTVTFTLNGKAIGKSELTAPDPVARLTFSIVLKRLINALAGA